MKFVDSNPTLHGSFVLTATHADGSTEVLVNDPNLIVYSGRRSLAKSLLNQATDYINLVAFGQLSAGASISPSTETVTNPKTAVLGTDYTMTTIDESDGAPPRIQYVISIPTTGLVGQTFNCMALMLTNGKAFAVKQFGDIVKSSATALSVTWIIYL